MIRFSLRLPDDVHRRVKLLAERERRSINEQIVRMLETHPEVLEAMTMTETDRLTPEQAWEGFVGDQTVDEFVSIMQERDGITDIDEMARRYVADIPAMLDVEPEDLPDDLTDRLADYIRRQVESQACQLANEKLLDRRDSIERGEAQDYSLSDADLDAYLEFERWLTVPEGRRAFREEWERGAREMAGS